MDFREQFKKNQRKTKVVITTFVFIMFFVGLLADVSIAPLYPSSLTDSLKGLLMLEGIPYITIVVLAITAIGIFGISKKGHKIMLSGTKYRLISQEDNDLGQDERMLINILEEMRISASLPYTPKLYIMETDDMNAFAAGWNENNTLVGVTRGLLNGLNRAEIQAVMAHEIGHIIHGDSKLTLYVGVLANVILTVTNIFSHIAFFITGSNNAAANKARLLLLLLNLILPILTQILYLYLSRSREYMADAAAVQLTGDNQAMISALNKISGSYESNGKGRKSKKKKPKVGDNFRASANIYETGDSIFSTHPSIENRVKKLSGEK